MSTYLHLECREHEPAISSNGEVGQHLYDLPAVREYIKNREAMATVVNMDGVNLSGFASNAASFFLQHPQCPVTIVDEYGETHPLEDEKDNTK